MAAVALTCVALAACATAQSGAECEHVRRADTSPDSSQGAPRTAGFALAAVFPSGMLDAVLVTLATLSLANQSEHDDDFLSAFGRRILSGRSPN